MRILPRLPRRVRVAVILLAGLLAGCGGGHQAAPPAARTGKATFVVKWPARTSRLIPIASNSIRVVLMKNGAEVGNQLLPRPPGAETSQAVFDPLPTGNLIATATAFPNADGTGVAQATGTAGLNILPGANTTITLTMGTTITKVVVAPAS